jgi:hypothetical protein
MSPEKNIIENLVKMRGFLRKVDPRALTPIQLPRVLDELDKTTLEAIVKMRGLLEQIDPKALTPILLPDVLDELVKMSDLLKKIDKRLRRKPPE